jgi:hypothetical protein
MVLPTLVRGCWLYVEWGSSASGRRRSLRYEGGALNLPQVRNLREVGDNRLHEGDEPTYGFPYDLLMLWVPHIRQVTHTTWRRKIFI